MREKITRRFICTGQNLCEGDNGGCSHICYPLPTIGMTASIASGCMCPDGLTLSSNNKTCITPGKFDLIISI